MQSYLVLLLIFSPFEVPFVPREASEPYWRALKQTAEALELTGKRRPWITDFRSEVSWVRQHYAEATEGNYPPLSDAYRLPPRHVCLQLYRFYGASEYSLTMQRGCRLHRWEEFSELICQAETAQRVWMLAAEAQDEDRILVERRRCLAKLRGLVGDDAFYEGRLWP